MATGSTTPKKSKLSIAALVPGLMDGAVIGLVSRLTELKEYTNAKGNGQVFSFVLADDQKEIRVSVFGRDLKNHHDLCQDATAVRVSGGWVKSANPAYNSADNEFEMTLSVDKNATLMATQESVDRPPAVYKRIGDLSAVAMQK